jgi:hypothetical protein
VRKRKLVSVSVRDDTKATGHFDMEGYRRMRNLWLTHYVFGSRLIGSTYPAFIMRFISHRPRPRYAKTRGT